jgi:DNA repair exonuclease SbcCD ATPase subunit
MKSQFIHKTALVIAVFVAISFCLIDADAQTRRKRRPRRVVRPVITNPVIVPADQQKATDSGDKIISTADEAEDVDPDETTDGQDTTTKPVTGTSKPAANGEQDIQQSINSLSNQVNKLNDKLGEIQDSEQALRDIERLSRAEQRAENLRSQQLEVETKLADLQSRLEDTEWQMKPENIEREMATFGSTRPELARDARRRKLESDRNRILAQIKILETSRVRLDSATATADAEVDLLRRRLDLRRAQDTVPADGALVPKNRSKPE